MGNAEPSAPPQGFNRFDVWKQYEEIAMHFNDLLLRLRTQSLAAIGAVAAVTGFVFKNDANAPVRWEMLAGVFTLLLCFWVAIWVLDFAYYNRLLLGAVDALLELEAASTGHDRVDDLILSTRIEKAVGGDARKRTHHSVGRWFFYGVVFVALLGGFLLSIDRWFRNP